MTNKDADKWGEPSQEGRGINQSKPIDTNSPGYELEHASDIYSSGVKAIKDLLSGNKAKTGILSAGDWPMHAPGGIYTLPNNSSMNAPRSYPVPPLAHMNPQVSNRNSDPVIEVNARLGQLSSVAEPVSPLVSNGICELLASESSDVAVWKAIWAHAETPSGNRFYVLSVNGNQRILEWNGDDTAIVYVSPLSALIVENVHTLKNMKILESYDTEYLIDADAIEIEMIIRAFFRAFFRQWLIKDIDFTDIALGEYAEVMIAMGSDTGMYSTVPGKYVSNRAQGNYESVYQLESDDLPNPNYTIELHHRDAQGSATVHTIASISHRSDHKSIVVTHRLRVLHDHGIAMGAIGDFINDYRIDTFASNGIETDAFVVKNSLWDGAEEFAQVFLALISGVPATSLKPGTNRAYRKVSISINW